jgi:hypothetical protein
MEDMMIDAFGVSRPDLAGEEEDVAKASLPFRLGAKTAKVRPFVATQAAAFKPKTPGSLSRGVTRVGAASNRVGQAARAHPVVSGLSAAGGGVAAGAEGHHQYQRRFGKAQKKQPQASTGRMVTGTLFPGIHGAIAGKKGSKLKAATSEYAPAAAGSISGNLATRGRNPGLAAGLSFGGAAAGTTYAQQKGYYKREPASKAYNDNSTGNRLIGAGAATAATTGAAGMHITRNAKPIARLQHPPMTTSPAQRGLRGSKIAASIPKIKRAGNKLAIGGIATGAGLAAGGAYARHRTSKSYTPIAMPAEFITPMRAERTVDGRPETIDYGAFGEPTARIGQSERTW